MIVHKQFFGDAEREFALPIPMMEELQRQTGVGILALARSVLNHACGVNDILQTIRLALIGGGANPAEAYDLVKAYVEPRPLIEAWTLAVEIINATLHGVEPASGEAA